MLLLLLLALVIIRVDALKSVKAGDSVNVGFSINIEDLELENLLSFNLFHHVTRPRLYLIAEHKHDNSPEILPNAILHSRKQSFHRQLSLLFKCFSCGVEADGGGVNVGGSVWREVKGSGYWIKKRIRHKLFQVRNLQQCNILSTMDPDQFGTIRINHRSKWPTLDSAYSANSQLIFLKKLHDHKVSVTPTEDKNILHVNIANITIPTDINLDGLDSRFQLDNTQFRILLVSKRGWRERIAGVSKTAFSITPITQDSSNNAIIPRRPSSSNSQKRELTVLENNHALVFRLKLPISLHHTGTKCNITHSYPDPAESGYGKIWELKCRDANSSVRIEVSWSHMNMCNSLSITGSIYNLLDSQRGFKKSRGNYFMASQVTTSKDQLPSFFYFGFPQEHLLSSSYPPSDSSSSSSVITDSSALIIPTDKILIDTLQLSFPKTETSDLKHVESDEL